MICLLTFLASAEYDETVMEQVVDIDRHRLFFTTPGRICCRLLTLFPAYQCAKGSKKEL